MAARTLRGSRACANQRHHIARVSRVRTGAEHQLFNLTSLHLFASCILLAEDSIPVLPTAIYLSHEPSLIEIDLDATPTLPQISPDHIYESFLESNFRHDGTEAAPRSVYDFKRKHWLT